MFQILVLLFTVVPALEIFLLFKVGGSIGAMNTFLIVILTGIVGAALAKSQGLSILMKIQNQVNQGSIPGNEIIQGLMVFAGGLLLLTPGFATDILGFSLVMPGPRHLLVGIVKSAVMRGMKNGNVHFSTFGGGQNRQGGGFYYSQSNSQSSQDDFFGQSSHQQVDSNTFEAEYTKKDE